MVVNRMCLLFVLQFHSWTGKCWLTHSHAHRRINRKSWWNAIEEINFWNIQSKSQLILAKYCLNIRILIFGIPCPGKWDFKRTQNSGSILKNSRPSCLVYCTLLLIRIYVIIWRDKIVSAFCSSNYVWCEIGWWKKSESDGFFLFFAFFSWSFPHIRSTYLVYLLLFSWKSASITICFYARRQKLLRRVMSTFSYKLLGLRSHRR